MKGNWKLYLVIIAVGLGGFFEALKSSSSHWSLKNSSEAHLTPLEVRSLDTSHYSVSKSERLKTMGKASYRTRQSIETKKLFSKLKKQLKGSSKIKKHEFGKKGVKGQGKKDKKKKDKKKKKKKSKKKVATPKGTGSPEETATAEEKEASDESPEEETTIYEYPHSEDEDPNAPEDQDRKDREDFEKWAELLLDVPHFENTSKFIEAHRASLISDTVFYQISNQMVQDDRSKMKVLGVRAIGSTLSYQSFNSLVSVLENSDSGQEVRNQANKNLNQYDAINQLPIIEAVLKNSSSSLAIVTAATLLNRMIKTQNKLPIDEEKYGELGYHPQIEVFQGLLPILQELATSNTDSYVTNSIRTALDTLEDLMSA